MALNEVKVRRDEFPGDSLENKVLTKFLTQPSQIGLGIGSLRRLDLKNPDDREMYLSAVESDIQDIRSLAGFRSHALIDAVFQEGLELLNR